MKRRLTLFLLFAVLAGSLALPQSTTTGAKKKPAPKTASSKKAKGKSSAVAAASWRNRQMTPTPERYKEIQQALADKGYLKSEPNGVWDADSAAALQQFQTDKKLTPTGKLSSASLIALGLGPKTAAIPPSEPAPPAPAN
jgi:peptidoglycan hydrolase-like protein with peptidoglycan-binding domain